MQDGPDAKPLGRGTRIELVLKEDMAEFLEERKVNISNIMFIWIFHEEKTSLMLIN